MEPEASVVGTAVATGMGGAGGADEEATDSFLLPSESSTLLVFAGLFGFWKSVFTIFFLFFATLTFLIAWPSLMMSLMHSNFSLHLIGSSPAASSLRGSGYLAWEYVMVFPLGLSFLDFGDISMPPPLSDHPMFSISGQATA
jgi:hypothetical protein